MIRGEQVGNIAIELILPLPCFRGILGPHI